MSQEELKGWWAFGNGGHRMVSNADGPDYPETMIPKDPMVFFSQLPFVMIPVGVPYPASRDLTAYSDFRHLTVGGVKYACWYRKRLIVIDGELQASLDEEELKSVLDAVQILYGDLNYAILSEVIVYNDDGSFQYRSKPAFTPLRFINSLTGHLN